MGVLTRILILDLLAERAEFGHGGNQEVVRPFLKSSDVEVLLITPQMQSPIHNKKLNSNPDITLTKEDVPNWDDEFPFWSLLEVELENKKVPFRRIIMPMVADYLKMKCWLEGLNIDVVICSGSRRNVSIWEEWMAPSALLMHTSSNYGIPTLGICFGHQLLCHSYGGKVERHDSLSSGIWELDLTKIGKEDKLLTSHLMPRDNISGLYTHQDHVISVPFRLDILATTTHNKITAVRVNDGQGNPLPSWGLQFHPEAAKNRIKRAYEWGHISEDEFKSFKGEHDGAEILSSFANLVLKYHCRDEL